MDSGGQQLPDAVLAAAGRSHVRPLGPLAHRGRGRGPLHRGHRRDERARRADGDGGPRGHVLAALRLLGRLLWFWYGLRVHGGDGLHVGPLRQEEGLGAGAGVGGRVDGGYCVAAGAEGDAARLGMDAGHAAGGGVGLFPARAGRLVPVPGGGDVRRGEPTTAAT